MVVFKNLKMSKLFHRLPNKLIFNKISYVTCPSPVLACAAKAKATDPPPKLLRLVRQEPGKVELGLIPVEWVYFFRPKTGITGFYTFCTALGLFLCSKEYFVMEHEYYGGISMAITCYLAVTRVGPPLAKYLDKEIDDYEATWNQGRDMAKAALNEQIKDEEWNQESLLQSLNVIQAKRENVALQLEAVYRARLMKVYTDVMGRLNYQVRLGSIQNHYVQMNLIQYVLAAVNKSITDDFQNKYLQQCFDDLTAIASKAKA